MYMCGQTVYADLKKTLDKVTQIMYNTDNTDGGIAQLGERLNGIQEVMGSIPTISTRKKHSFMRVLFS